MKFFNKNKVKYSINYIYFSFVFLFFLFIITHHLFVLKNAYFLPYAFLQTLIEISFIILIGKWIRKKHISLYYIYICICFIFFVFQFANFIMLSMMDSSLTYAYNNLFSEGLKEFLITLRALNLKPAMLILLPCLALIIPLAGIAAYFLTNKFSQKKPLVLDNKHFIKTILLSFSLLLISDFFITKNMSHINYVAFQKRLPLFFTFMQPSPKILSFNKTLQPLGKEPDIDQIIKTKQLSMSHKPNIFLFIIETIRHDYITKDIAPHLYAFKQSHLSSSLSTSAANASHDGWFSILYGKYPFYWKQCKKYWTKGSTSLRLLKKMGYKTHVISAAELGYFHMDEVLFGHNHEVLDSYMESAQEITKATWQRDQETIEKLIHSVEKQGSHAYIIFLDSTHSEYSWPDNYETKFKPTCDTIDYVMIGLFKKDLEKVKNRYRNAIHFVDHLIGNFLNSLKNKKMYDDSIIVITADHGEEFFEQGALFHGTHLNSYQTNVPLYCKLSQGFKQSLKKDTLISHIDIFPTIFSHLCGKELPELFDGEPFFKPNKWPYTLVAHQSCGRTPKEFFLYDGKNRLYLQFAKQSIFNQKDVAIPKITNQKEKPIYLRDDFDAYIKKNFAKALDRLFIRQP